MMSAWRVTRKTSIQIGWVVMRRTGCHHLDPRNKPGRTKTGQLLRLRDPDQSSMRAVMTLCSRPRTRRCERL
jgi:hypothetical protein